MCETKFQIFNSILICPANVIYYCNSEMSRSKESVSDDRRFSDGRARIQSFAEKDKNNIFVFKIAQLHTDENDVLKPHPVGFHNMQ